MGDCYAPPQAGPSLSGSTQCSRGGVSPAKAINRLGVEGGNCRNCPIHRRLEKLPRRASSSGPGACVLLSCCRRSRPTFLPFIEGMSSGRRSTRSPSRAAPSSEAQCSLDACDVNPPPPRPGLAPGRCSGPRICETWRGQLGQRELGDSPTPKKQEVWVFRGVPAEKGRKGVVWFLTSRELCAQRSAPRRRLGNNRCGSRNTQWVLWPRLRGSRAIPGVHTAGPAPALLNAVFLARGHTACSQHPGLLLLYKGQS